MATGWSRIPRLGSLRSTSLSHPCKNTSVPCNNDPYTKIISILDSPSIFGPFAIFNNNGVDIAYRQASARRELRYVWFGFIYKLWNIWRRVLMTVLMTVLIMVQRPILDIIFFPSGSQELPPPLLQDVLQVPFSDRPKKSHFLLLLFLRQKRLITAG